MPHPIAQRYVAISLLCTATAAFHAPALAAQVGSAEVRARLTGRVADAVGSAIVKAEILVTNTAFVRRPAPTEGSSSQGCPRDPSK